MRRREVGAVVVLAGWLIGFGVARAASGADQPTPARRPVALYISGCPSVTEEAARRIVAVELGARLLAAGSAAPPDVDRLLVSCRGQQARLEAGDPASSRYAERTLALDQFPGDGRTRAVALAALELLAALDRPRAPPPAGAALDEYQQNFVWFYDGHSGLGRHWVPYHGKYHEPLSGADFYEAIDRSDLASSYRWRRAVNITMFSAGTALWIYALFAFHDNGWLTIGCVAGGFVVGATGYFRSNDPVDESTARRLADEHNKRLKLRLGLPRDLSPDQSPQPVMRGWNVSAAISPGGGAVALKLNF